MSRCYHDFTEFMTDSIKEIMKEIIDMKKKKDGGMKGFKI